MSIPIEIVRAMYNKFPETSRDLFFEDFNKEIQEMADPKTQMQECRAFVMEIHRGKINKMVIDQKTKEH